MNLDDLKRELFGIIDLTDQPRVAIDKAIDHLNAKGYLQLWQPIENAPRDGTKVDLWCNGRRWTDCKWTGAYWFSPDGISDCGAEMELHGYFPSHWILSPNSPEETE